MARRNSLQAVLERQAKTDAQGFSQSQSETPAAGAPDSETRTVPAAAPKFHRPSREGRKLIAGHFDPKVAKQLKLLAAEEETTVQALLEEALDLLFLKKGRGIITRL